MRRANFRRRLLAGASSALLLGSLFLTLAPAAQAVALECDVAGETWITWSTSAKPWKVLHAVAYEHFTGGQGEYTKYAQLEGSITASVTYSVGVKAGIETPIASLGAEENLTLKAEGSITVQSSVKIVENLDHFAVYVFYDGTHRVTGSFTTYKCSSSYKVVVANKGTATSWDAPRDGALACDRNPPSGSLGYLVKQQYC